MIVPKEARDNYQEILSELHERAFKELTKNFNEIETSELPTTEKLRKALENHALVVANNSALVKIFFHDEHEIPKDLREIIRDRRKSYTQKIIKIYEHGLKEGVFRKEDPKIAVYFLLGSCNWLCRWYADTGVIDSESIVRSFLRLLQKGYEID